MKILKFALIMTVIVIGLNSCQKDDEPKDEPKSVVGTWEGNWGYYNDFPFNYEKWEIEKSGVLNAFVLDGTLFAVGTCDQDDDEIEVHYTSILEDPYSLTFKGTYVGDGDTITGKWTDDAYPLAIEGTFKMYRR